MDLELTSKRAIVTGGRRGIGRAIAAALAADGAHVVIASRDADDRRRTRRGPFLASPRSVAINGSTIDVGGGTLGNIFH
jgi:nucleoside-diphosphate-sugar epimerase